MATHDKYENCGPDILAFVLVKAAERDIKMVQAYVAVRDQIKLRWFQEAGLEQVVTLPGQLCVEGEMIDVIVLEGDRKIVMTKPRNTRLGRENRLKIRFRGPPYHAHR